jgi:hypothetical protein
MDLLHLERFWLLSQISLLGKSATDRRALLPISVDSGIECLINFISLCHSPNFPSILQQEKWPRQNLILFAEDMKTLSSFVFQHIHLLCHSASKQKYNSVSIVLFDNANLSLATYPS